MAVIGRNTRVGNLPGEPARRESLSFDPTADTVELQVIADLPNTFVRVNLFDGSGDPLQAGTAGTFDVAVRVPGGNSYEFPTVYQIDATANATIGVQGPVRDVRVTPNGVTGVASAVVVINQMEN